MITESLVQKLRGTVFILAGIVLLFYNFGFFQKLGTTVLVLFSLFLVVAGFFDAGFYKKFMKKS